MDQSGNVLTQFTHCHSWHLVFYCLNSLHIIGCFMTVFMWHDQQQEYRCTHNHTHGHSPLSLPHPVPLSLLVEQNDDQLGVHLVSVLAERQIAPLECHIHQVPVEGNVRERESWGSHHSLKNIVVSGNSQRLYLLYMSISSVVGWLSFLNINISLCQFVLMH